ncbi:MAG: hypothetical protein QF492_08920 [Candidatus Krumholzibacteria bacterium]|jgi:hypothetical protein|nr:hypothetical protein [Candidatus Krumholzibacteria bacterium]MDP6670006.1 hypothetical protein [Candidatus Krumholzibacteria bacterium]MDP6796989.1 hypothetical protein [Candidatus Krumholzibacteria bacterium]MDP7022536.1 hypothetical protein [Candidatus Krumholzibacteria bacterium]
MKAILLLPLFFVPLAGSPPERVPSPLPDNGFPEFPRDGADLILSWDDGSFEALGTSPDWTDESAVNVELPAGGPWRLESVHFFLKGQSEKALIFRSVSSPGSEPSALIDSTIHFLPPEEAAWIEVDASSLDWVLEEGDLLSAGCRFDGNDDGIGLDESCSEGFLCGPFWSFWNEGWTLDSDYGFNLGIRVQFSDVCPDSLPPTLGFIASDPLGDPPYRFTASAEDESPLSLSLQIGEGVFPGTETEPGFWEFMVESADYFVEGDNTATVTAVDECGNLRFLSDLFQWGETPTEGMSFSSLKARF